MKRLFPLLASLLIVISLTITASAHSGRTDSNGGHWDHSTGTYHYHNDGSYQGGSSSYSSSSSSAYRYDLSDLMKKFSEGRTEGYNEGYEKGYGIGYATCENDLTESLTFCAITYAVIGCFLFSCFLILVLKRKRDALEHQKKQYEDRITSQCKKASKDLDEQKKYFDGQLENLRKLMAANYGDRYLYHLSGAPDGDYIDEKGMPHSNKNPLIDCYMFYLGGYNKTKYHRGSCRYALHFLPVNAHSINNRQLRKQSGFNQSETYEPCSICRPVLPDTSWVFRYNELSNLFEQRKDDAKQP